MDDLQRFGQVERYLLNISTGNRLNPGALLLPKDRRRGRGQGIVPPATVSIEKTQAGCAISCDHTFNYNTESNL
jgi:hypothetical protein